MSYWPWWAGAAFLGLFAIVFLRVVRRPFAVSGAWARVLGGPDRTGDASAADIEAALLRATEEEFGLSAEASAAAPLPEPAWTPPANATWSTQVTFLASILVGGLVAAVTSGRFGVRGDLGPEFARLVGSGAVAVLVLVVGGVLVGLGTRMAGGCTSGHGLNGVARLQPASLLATASFFGAGVATSLLLGWLG